jgi:hypothetical protein
MIRELIQGFSKRQRAQICQNGHVVDPSWDTCPYCSVPPRAGPSQRSQDTVVVHSRVAAEKGRLVGWIVALNGAHEDEDFRLHVGTNIVGSESTCDVVLSDPSISRRHCLVRCEGDGFEIADLSSRNKTYVNGELVQKHPLIDNDVVRLGDVELEFKARGIRSRRG